MQYVYFRADRVIYSGFHQLMALLDRGTVLSHFGTSDVLSLLLHGPLSNHRRAILFYTVTVLSPYLTHM